MCEITTKLDCDGPCDSYKGDGSTCGGIITPEAEINSLGVLDADLAAPPQAFCAIQIPSACCLPDGTCVDTTSCLCNAQGGTSQGVFQTCANLPPNTCGGAPFCTDANTKGCWGDVLNFGVNSVNMVALKTGKVLISHQSFSAAPCPDPPSTPTGRCYQLFDPATDKVGGRLKVTTDHNLYCAGFDQLGDGRVLWAGSVGGDDLTATSIYDPDLGQWSSEQDGFSPRFYPTLKTLPNGKVVVVGGSTCNCCSASVVVPDIDVFDASQPVGSQWTTLTNATFLAPPNDFVLALYARMEGLSDGSFMYTGASFADRCGTPASGRFTRVLDPVLEVWTRPFAQQDAIPGGPGLLFAKDVMMKANGGMSGALPIPNAYVLDMTVPNPAWVEIAPMNKARRESYLIALPSGEIVVTGGTNNSGIVREAEIYDPAGGFGMGNTWTLGAAADKDHVRAEHSSAVLLVDGRVLVAGNDLTGQVYYPPYLFDANDALADRPVITGVAGAGTNLIRYGEGFSMTATFPAGETFGSVRLIRLGASTHSLDQGQQSMALSFVPDCCNPNDANCTPSMCGGVKVAAPLQPGEAPPGFYYLFVMSSSGVPSQAAMVQLESCP